MPRIPLTGGAYTAKSIIANAQRCVNLYSETNPEGSNPPVPVTYYLTPGLVPLTSPTVAAGARCLYRASNGELFYVTGTTVYFVGSDWALTPIGMIPYALTPCKMSDNGTAIILVDGVADHGWEINLTTHAFTAIVDSAFYGSPLIDFLDGYFLLSRPGLPTFYISDFNDVEFNPLWFADKFGYPDALQGVIEVHRQVLLIGTLTSEIFFNSGAADFPFQVMPGTFIEHGCAAPYSIARTDVNAFWVGQDQEGQGMIFKYGDYQVSRISTHAIENEIQKYSTLTDAVGFIYQQEGHVFYMLTFPSADKTWCFDLATSEWHQRVWIDDDGIEHRHRGVVGCSAYGKIVVGDWETGELFALDLETYTDNGQPIIRIRSFPHLVNEADRVYYSNVTADMEVGRQTDGTVVFPQAFLMTEREFVPDAQEDEPDYIPQYLIITEDGWPLVSEPSLDNGPPISVPDLVYLRWSDDRGITWNTRIPQSLGAVGEYRTVPSWSRLGMARDRVFELSWSAPTKTAMQSLFVDFVKGAT